MYNLRYKMLLIICALFSSVQIALGDINASHYYTKQTHKFLGYLGCENASDVPVRKIAKTDKHYKNAAGYANGTAIYLNEDSFAKHSEGINLFTCAHEAAHHALGHPYQVHANSLDIEKEADVTAARMLCKNGYMWALKEEVTNLKHAVNAGHGGDTDGLHPTVSERHKYLNAVLQEKGEVGRKVGEGAVPGVAAKNAAKKAVHGASKGGVGAKPSVGVAKKPGAGKAGTAQGAKPGVGTAKAGAGKPKVGAGAPKNNSGKMPSDAENKKNRDGRRGLGKYTRVNMEDIKNLLQDFNNLTREQKLILAAALAAGFFGWR